MPLDTSQLLPTFLNLINLPNPTTWLANIFPSLLAGALFHSRTASVAAAGDRKSIAFEPDHDENSSSDTDSQSSEFENSESESTKGARKQYQEGLTRKSTMTQMNADEETEFSTRTKGQSSEGNDGATTPTQSKTLEHAQRPNLGRLNQSDLGSLTPEQIAQLQANMLEDIQDSDSRPLVSSVQPMETLMNEYSDNPNFVRKMEWLKKQGWLGVRRTKGDGDCFYRSFAFAWVERILRAKDQELAVGAGISTLHTTFQGLGAVGFETTLFVDFYDCLRSLVEQVITPDPNGQLLNASLLLEAFTSPETSNSIVSYVRLLTSAELRTNQDEYAAFVVHPETQESMSIIAFCNYFVEGMGKEADHVQMQALSKAMGVNLSVAYLDGSINNDANGDAPVDFVKFDNGGGDSANGIDDVVLLYRPGHYDILEHRAHEHRSSAASALVTPAAME